MGVVAVVSCITFILIDALRRKGRTLLFTALGLLLCLATAAIVVPGVSWERLSTTGAELSSGDLNARTVIWAAGLKSVAERPIFGVGAGAFAAGIAPFVPATIAAEQYVAHNTFLSTLAELGFPGFLLFIAVLASTIRKILQIDAAERRIWLTAFAVWAIGVSTLTWEHRKPTWVLIGLAIQYSAAFTRSKCQVNPAILIARGRSESDRLCAGVTGEF